MKLDDLELCYAEERLELLQDRLTQLGDTLRRQQNLFLEQAAADLLDAAFEQAFLLTCSLKRLGGDADTPTAADVEDMTESVRPLLDAWRRCRRSRTERRN